MIDLQEKINNIRGFDPIYEHGVKISDSYGELIVRYLKHDSFLSVGEYPDGFYIKMKYITQDDGTNITLNGIKGEGTSYYVHFGDPGNKIFNAIKNDNPQ
jgi:hypothetical protein